MERFLGSQSELFYALLRFAAGFMLSFHGMQKLFGAFGGRQPEIFSQMWIGGVLELVGGLFVAAGFLTSWAAFLLAGMMAVAYFQFHFKFDFGGGNLWPIVNKGELAALYSFVFLLIASRGSGTLSVDSVRR